MIVVDASVLVTALADDGPEGDAVRLLLLPGPLAAPELVDLEVLSAVRRLQGLDQLSTARAEAVVEDLRALPLERAPHAPLLRRCWQLRANLTVYDASYVALAEALGAPLLTADRRLARADGPRCEIRLLPPLSPGIA